ncbi:Cadherin-7 [Camelus dromedarius]|uniref:Cadherin-7 n=1 Tax=Camelus dromedarius TaxID=9838 RepID=A0A5N4CBI4_CAMDR|nr:Cadherin-7 [Camelus dromedarius]
MGVGGLDLPYSWTTDGPLRRSRGRDQGNCVWPHGAPCLELGVKPIDQRESERERKREKERGGRRERRKEHMTALGFKERSGWGRVACPLLPCVLPCSHFCCPHFSGHRPSLRGGIPLQGVEREHLHRGYSSVGESLRDAGGTKAASSKTTREGWNLPGFPCSTSCSDVRQGQLQLGNVNRQVLSIFIIDENTGDIHATKRLDREEQAYYTLRAQALDRLTNKPVEPESEFVIKIQDINDNEPRFLDGPYTAGVPEMQTPSGQPG